jgi:hypothetical protein
LRRFKVKMNRHIVVAALVACAGTAVAQDSISNAGTSLPGDGLSPWAPAAQQASYVVDLSPFATSWGTTFGIAPIMKTSRASSGFTGSLGSAQFLSNDLVIGAAQYASDAYALWENAPGFGVNPANNNTPNTVNPSGMSNRFAAAFTEFSTNNGAFNYNGVLTAIVNYNPNEPGRLFVKRVVSAVNTADDLTGDSAQIGFGSVDADGNTYFRADDFGLAGSPALPSVTGNNLFRVRANARGPVVNQISGNIAAHDATDALATGNGGVLVVPNNIPASVAALPAIATVDFGGNFVRGAAAPLTADTTHLDPIVAGTRGALGSTLLAPLGSGVSTYAVLAQDGSGSTNGFNLFSVDATGNVIDKTAMYSPTMVTDNDDGFTLTYSGVQEFLQYRSQTPFRGGTGQIALGKDRNGLGLAAATMHENGLSDDFSTQIIVARHDATTGATEWAMAAYIDQVFDTGRSGKEILDGPGGNVIGVLTPLFNVTGGIPLGPSMSTPVFDAAGNIWFVGAVELFDLGGGFSDFDSALLRAVYDETTFSYQLELIVQLGQSFAGLNSGRNWSIRFTGIADSNSVDSGTMFSGNGSSTTWNGTPIADLANVDARTSGGIVLNAAITYDVDNDGVFDTALGIDEGYNALLYIGVVPEVGGPCNDADFAEPFGTLDFFDVQAFLGLFSAMDPAADLVPDGIFDFFDVQAFLQAFSAGCP